MTTIRLGRTFIHIQCKRYHIRKKYCDIECDFLCQLNKNGGSKVIHSLHDISKEFHITTNQLKCAVHDGILHAEMFLRGSRQEIFLSEDEVGIKLDTIRAYSKKSVEEIDRQKNKRRLKCKNNMAAESLSDDLCTITKASNEFGISIYKLYNALDFGIIHSQTKNGSTRYLLSRAEIQKNLELVKKSSRIFYRLLNMKKQQPSQEGQQILEIHQQMGTNLPVPVDNNLRDKCQGVIA